MPDPFILGIYFAGFVGGFAIGFVAGRIVRKTKQETLADFTGDTDL